jgi:hypothetical protein
MIGEREQLEAWWASLDEERRRAVLEADVDDLPGWIVASAVAASADIANDPTTDDAADFKARVEVALQEYIAAKRAEG